MKKLLFGIMLLGITAIGLGSLNMYAMVGGLGNTITGTSITGGNQSSYAVRYNFNGTTESGDRVTIELSGGATTLLSNHISMGGETGVSVIFNASGLTEGVVTLSGSIESQSGIYLTGSKALTNVRKDTIAPLSSLSYSITGMTTMPVVVTITLTESGTIVNNSGLNNYTFNGNGSFVFFFKDSYGNAGNRTAIVSNMYYIMLGGGSAYIPYDYTSNNLIIDYCPNGDYSSSNRDGICSYGVPANNYPLTVIQDRIIEIPTVQPRVANIENSVYSKEMNNAFLYAFKNNITTISNIEEANIKGKISRAQLSKMISNYAVSLGKMADANTVGCSFTDLGGLDYELQDSVLMACRMHIMGNGLSYFNPNATVTRAEFATTLSRVLYGSLYEGGIPYYEHHLKNLKNEGVISNMNPDIQESRGNILLMIYRSIQ